MWLLEHPLTPPLPKKSRLIQIGFHSQNKSCNQIGNDSHKKNFQLSFLVVMKSLWLRRKKPPSQGMNYEPGSRSLKTSGYNSDSVLSSLVCKTGVWAKHRTVWNSVQRKKYRVKLRNAPIPCSTLHFCVVWTVTNPETIKVNDSHLSKFQNSQFAPSLNLIPVSSFTSNLSNG